MISQSVIRASRALPVVSILDATPVIEGDTGWTPAMFNVSLSAPCTNAVAIEFFTLDGTAQSGRDYAPTNGVVTFRPGQTNGAVAVRVLSNKDGQTNETFRVQLRNPSNPLLGRCEATAAITVTHRNQPPTISAIADQKTVENQSTGTITFTVGDMETLAQRLIVTASSWNEA